MSSETKNVTVSEATVVMSTASVAVTGKDQSGRVFEPFVLGFDGAVALFNKSATSENLVLAAAEKAAYVVGSVFLAIAEAFINVFAGLYNMAIAPVNYLFGKEEKQPEETKETSVASQPTTTECAPSAPTLTTVTIVEPEDAPLVVEQEDLRNEEPAEEAPAARTSTQKVRDFAEHYSSKAVAAMKASPGLTTAVAFAVLAYPTYCLGNAVGNGILAVRAMYSLPVPV